MTPDATHAVTGAFGYSGKYITRRLLDEGRKVLTLTNSVRRANPFGDQVRAVPFHFDRPELLEESLRGVSVLYNTYWVRFNHRAFTFAEAVRNTRTLFAAAQRAGVRRVVHVSITNPSEASPLGYFRGKAVLERALKESGLSYCILRPTVLFGKEDILINNIAWSLRRFPLFPIFGDGQYKLQPMHVDDLARLAVAEGKGDADKIINAIGPETFTYRGLVETIGRIIGCPRPPIPVPPALGHVGCWALGKMVGDVMITRDEIRGLMANLLYVDAPPAGEIQLTDWTTCHAKTLGRKYTSELARRIDRRNEYKSN
jgi:NADH dehydrogenase